MGLFSFPDRAYAAENGNKVQPGELIIDHLTLINLGCEWLIQGDDNRNAEVTVKGFVSGAAPAFSAPSASFRRPLTKPFTVPTKCKLSSLRPQQLNPKFSAPP